MFAVVDPALDELQQSYWQARRFVPHPITFESFLHKLDDAVPLHTRAIASLSSKDALSISRWFSGRMTPSNGLTRYLSEELVHVHPAISSAGVSAKEFYSGSASAWAVFQQELDQKRAASDELILLAVLDAAPIKSTRTYLLKGHAGSGKSVTLARFAWDAAENFEGKVLYLKEGGVVRPDLIEEILELTEEAVVFVVDDALVHAADLNRLVSDCEKRCLPLRLVIGARTNEWNVSNEIDFSPSEEIELQQLKEGEIVGLLSKLAQHKCLGELAHLTLEEQKEHFRLHSDRQLMVALHEATTGQKFHEIAYDEYLHVQPPEARTLYLDVCTLHRLGVSVRAGLISRISNITFEQFSVRFFKPLEHVVHTYYDAASRDNAYRTRHQIIADFVFEQALPDPIERAAQITRIIRHLDTDYEPDAVAFRFLIKGRTLAELFADKRLVEMIFNAASENGAEEDRICHQRAVFELNHPHGDLQAAFRSITQAEHLCEGRDRAILHTKAIVLRQLALKTNHALEKNKYRADAKAILERLKTSTTHSHSLDTYGRLLLDEINEQLRVPNDGISQLADRTLSDQIRRLEETISSGLQRFPGDEHLLSLNADLAQTLDNEPRAFASLQSAGLANPGRPFIAIRLARALRKKHDLSGAKDVLRRCLELNPASKDCHFHLAKLLIVEDEFANRQEIEHHLRRSYTEGDTNFDAQLWFGRHELLYGDPKRGLEAFHKLGNARVPPVYRNKIRALIGGAAKPKSFNGSVRSLQHGFCFISIPELRFDIYARSSSFLNCWDELETGSRVHLKVGFNLRGPVAADGVTIIE